MDTAEARASLQAPAGGRSSILIVEDEKPLAQILRENLVRAGYDVTVAYTGPAGISAMDAATPDLVILDVMLPLISGFGVCEAIRTKSQVPVLMLTARDTEEDKLRGFEVGADDYLTKPFSMAELLARVRALLRRRPAEIALQLRMGNLELDLQAHMVKRDGCPVDLSMREFDLLAYLAQRRGELVSREQLLSEVWGYEYVGDSARAVDVTIWRLRSKIEENPHEPRYILSRRGLGYLFNPEL